MKVKNIWLWLTLIVVLLFVAKYSISSWRKYQIWEEHKAYFEKPTTERRIKAWMTPNFIKRHYDIDLASLLGFSPGFWEERDPLDTLCLAHKIDCATLVEKLNLNVNP